MCLRGGAAVQSEVLERLRDPALRAYFVWLPILGSDDLGAARRAAARHPDPRVLHFWDREGALGHALGDVLAIPPRPYDDGPHGTAWDVYLLYPPGTHWQGATPPVPTFWMHQLDQLAQSQAPRLSGAVLRTRLEALVKAR
jgi:hypothetical protein